MFLLSLINIIKKILTKNELFLNQKRLKSWLSSWSQENYPKYRGNEDNIELYYDQVEYSKMPISRIRVNKK